MIDLRRRAEEQLGPRVLAQSRLAYELELLQIELELQNEELRMARSDLRDAKQRYLDLYEHGPLGYVAVDTFGRIVESNMRLAEMIAVHHGELCGAPLATFMSDDDADSFQSHLRDVPADSAYHLDVHLVRSDGQVLPVRFDIVIGGDSCYRIAITRRAVMREVEEVFAIVLAALDLVERESRLGPDRAAAAFARGRETIARLRAERRVVAS
ncbi:MAG: sigma54 specific transcriptional regulator with sensor, Fis family [Myxococcales bacterium]|nr:sigma54 specific transcriptional regulator with sensor, Fis family [Myxococcales bacterium]